MIPFLLACASSPTDSGAMPVATVEPTEGPWTIAWDETYGGDCALADMQTRQPATIGWTVEREETGFTLRDEYDYPMGCTLDGTDFACSLGTYHIPWDASGYDATEYISTDIAGQFADADHLAASYTIHAECDGADCGEIGTQYGDAFTYPCSAVAGLSGTSGG